MGLYSLFSWPQIHVASGATVVAKLEQILSLSTQLTQAFGMAVDSRQRRVSSKGLPLVGEARVGDLEFPLKAVPLF